MASKGISSSIRNATVLLWIASLLVGGWFPFAISGIMMKGYESDRQALVAIKSEIDDDPFGVTNSWNNSVGLCHWKGITCGRKHQRVTKLDLSHLHLRGTLSPHVGNLSFLRFFSLDDNAFSGAITPEIGRLSRLELLNLANNSFGGTIPPNLSYCSNLVQFFANRNNLVGNIPAELGNLLKLENLRIGYNNLTGQLPSSLGNASALQVIHLKKNNLQGRLPDTLGLIKRLAWLGLSGNSFSASILPICNISSLELVDLGLNQFSGSLPFKFSSNLPNLQKFGVGSNNLSGTLPLSLSNASKLEQFDVSDNHFSSKVSLSFQQVNHLSWLNIGKNNLGTGGAGDLDFITTLINCSRLRAFGMDVNQFGGSLPNSITNLSKTLEYLYIGRNQIIGTIPLGITNLKSLIGLGLEYNQLTGTIPDSLGKLENLQLVALGGNALTGRIPTSVGNISQLTKIGLENNLLEGSIPSEFGKCQNLIEMDLHSNRLTGRVPKEIFSIVTLSTYLGISDNLLTGSLPSQVGNLKILVVLDISNNNFSGSIPAAIGSCVSLEGLNFRNNHFYGNIQSSLTSLKSLVELDLSNNNLSGQIPEGLEKLSFLNYLNLSYNQFEGQVPTKGAFSNATAIVLTGNDRLCGGIADLHLPVCNFNKTKEQKRTVPFKLILIVSGVLGVLLLLSPLLLCFCWLRKKGVRGEPSSSELRLGNSLLMVSFQQLLKATDGFSPANLIGQGSFGRVYRGILDQNQEQAIIAVKVMNLEKQGASKSFLTECKTLRNVRHRNLVKIISACSSIDFQGNPFKALIYEFMPNGSLERWLHAPSETNDISHEEGEPVILNFPKRLNVAIDVASALDYLHHHCEVPVVHCDLKPSNILLDHDMVAHVGDFGLARFFPNSMNNSSGNSTSTVGLKGTVGYAAPEYGTGLDATTTGDMYSYGILVLEMFTGKRPTDDMFKDGLTLHHFTKMALPDQVLEVVDPLLLSVNNEEENARIRSRPRTTEMQETKLKVCLISILRVGICCSAESPNDRMDIVDAARELLSIRNKFLGTRIQTPI